MLKRIRQIRSIQARRISTASSPYDNYTKLRAFPFEIGPEEAQRTLAPLASLACCHLGKIWPSLAAYILPSFNINFLRPARMSAVYFPAWFVTGEVEASVTYKGVQVKGSAWFDNTYFPGSHMAILSTAPLRDSSSLIKTETVPFTAPLLHQHGEPIQCIPFSTSPFSVLDIAASHPPSRSITINEDLSFDPSSVKPNLISAYPVLMPLYLAQYEIRDLALNSTGDMLTFIIKAYDNPELIDVMSESLSKMNPYTSGRRFIDILFDGREASGETYSFSPSESPRVSVANISMPQRKTTTNSVNEWLEEFLSSSRNIETLAEHSLDLIGNGDKDLRMREMTSEEGASLKRYTEFTGRIMSLKRSLTDLTVLQRDAIEQSDSFGPLITQQRKMMEEKIKELEDTRAQYVPKWWSEWLASK